MAQHEPSTTQLDTTVTLPRIKVCGVTRAGDIDFLCKFGVNAVGLNLVPSSKRFLDLDRANDLAKRCKDLGLSTVAVLMDPTEREFMDVSNAFAWDFIQLHGMEEPELTEGCPSNAIIKAVSWSGRREELDLVLRWSQFFSGRSKTQATLAGFLVDAFAPGQGGGTGQTARWDLLCPRPQAFGNWPIMLAGGLTSDNVRSAIQATHCDAVDTASGVELSAGIKCKEKVKRFADEARLGFAST
jgi:phosphoribosylanthranilate isomerase